jgi:hypothetical protein
MINVLTTEDFDLFKNAVFRNFQEVADLLRAVKAPESNQTGVPPSSGGSTTPSSGGGTTPDIYDVLYVGDYATKIYRSDSGDLTFEDVNAGAITLSQIAAVVSILWTFGDAFGIKAGNVAGTTKYFGLNVTEDGWNIYDAPEDAE